ncbi:Pre-mRNA-splicing factor of RES complex-domain-containing protein [Phellopilus nigrolimitatus]|nr:Pre-mRNA-splicing factor of RES complex-domain-containing protein [Phellopilus nigrolimitatus]
MQAYLAERYMSGPKADAILSRAAPSKKKKRKTALGAATGSASAMIVDDDGGWGKEAKDDNDELAEAVVEADRSFKKRKVETEKSGGGESSGWATVREGVKQESPQPEDEKPQVVDAPFTGGLVTSAQLKKALPQKGKDKAREETEEEREAARLAQETVYRDVTGRKIDTKAERVEAARKKREREEREAQKMEWGKGLVQREDEVRRRAQLEQERKRDLAVYADDRELNDEQKAKDRWNDPAAAFLTKKASKGPKKPIYSGPPPPPNRFGIRPGYRWDGVDRGNGFEKKIFQKQNERKRTGLESYQWSVDDM